MNSCIGTCSLCGGQVMGYVGTWNSVSPPPPGRCSSCGATAAQHGPVIPMVPAQRYVGPFPEPYWQSPYHPMTPPWDVTIKTTTSGTDVIFDETHNVTVTAGTDPL